MNIKFPYFNVLKVFILFVLIIFILYITHLFIFTFSIKAKALGNTENVSSKCNGDLKEISTKLDEYNINICTPFFPDNPFWNDDIDSKSPTLRSQSWNPFKEFMIKYFNKNESADSEGLRSEDTKDFDTLYKKMYQKRENEDKTILKNLSIIVSNNKITGFASLVDRNIDTLNKKPLLILDFYTEFDNKIWLIRVSEEEILKNKNKSEYTIIKDISNLNLDISKQSLLSSINDLKSNYIGAIIPSDIKNPDWWKGYDPNDPYNATFRDSCDILHFPGSKSMTGSSLGEARVGNVTACGPINRPTDKTTVIYYSPGAQGTGAGEYTWQCLEYSMRWMRLAYNESPYLLSGAGEARKIMTEYPEGAVGRHLKRIPNGTSLNGPTPGDVLAKGITGDGHTLVVKESHLNNDGTGYVIAVDQNSDTVGIRRIDMVSPWHLQDMNGWLHDPAGGTGVGICNIPSSGDWTISGSISCEITSSQTFFGNIYIKDSSSLTIKSNGSLDMNLSSKQINVQNGSKLIIQNGGKIY